MRITSFDQNGAQHIVGALIIIVIFKYLQYNRHKVAFFVSFCIVSLIGRSSMTSCIYQLFRFFFPFFVICLLCHWWIIFYMVLCSMSISIALNPGALICLTFKHVYMLQLLMEKPCWEITVLVTHWWVPQTRLPWSHTPSRSSFVHPCQWLALLPRDITRHYGCGLGSSLVCSSLPPQGRHKSMASLSITL